VGTDVFALVTEWEPMVTACRTAKGMDFYWDAVGRQNDLLWAAQEAGTPVDIDTLPELLPFAVDRALTNGSAFLAAGWYYEFFRPHLPESLREPADAFLGMIYPAACGLPDSPNDLCVDAGLSEVEDVPYAMRPATVRRALGLADAVPWDAMRAVGDRTDVIEMATDRRVPDYGSFDVAVCQQRDWLGEAAGAGRGLVVIISQ
jgi:hypothetical protein